MKNKFNINKINFLIVGAARSGSTTLYDYLKIHPDIYLPDLKEPHFFSGVSPMINTKEEYIGIFNNYQGESAVGEASTSYLFVPSTAKNIFDNLGKIKIIIILRNPVDRAYSTWLQSHDHRDIENLSFEDALKMEESRYQNRHELYFWPSVMYFRAGLYFEQVNRYINTFGKENIYVLIFEEFIKNPIFYCKRIYSFLNVNDSYTPPIMIKNKYSKPRIQFLYDFISPPPKLFLSLYKKFPNKIRQYIYLLVSKIHKANRNDAVKKQPLSTDTRKELQNKYYENIKKLEELLERDLSIWYKDN